MFGLPQVLEIMFWALTAQSDSFAHEREREREKKKKPYHRYPHRSGEGKKGGGVP